MESLVLLYQLSDSDNGSDEESVIPRRSPRRLFEANGAESSLNIISLLKGRPAPDEC